MSTFTYPIARRSDVVENLHGVMVSAVIKAIMLYKSICHTILLAI